METRKAAYLAQFKWSPLEAVGGSKRMFAKAPKVQIDTSGRPFPELELEQTIG